LLSSVTNSLRVLEYLVEEREAGVSEISRALDLTIGSVYRMVSTLSELGYVEQNPTNRRYRPGSKIPQLARRLTAGQDFVTLARPYLERLVAQTGETVNLGVLRDQQVVYVDRAVADQPLAVSVQIGSRVPAYCTALGRVMLANESPEVVAAYLEALDHLPANGAAEPPSRKAFSDILQQAKHEGHAVDRHEFSRDIACVAAPILDASGLARAAVSVSAPSSRAAGRFDDITPMVRATGKELSELLQLTGNHSVR
jgi:DNA-binding IclR family transcriptional regulator